MASASTSNANTAPTVITPAIKSITLPLTEQYYERFLEDVRPSVKKWFRHELIALMNLMYTRLEAELQIRITYGSSKEPDGVDGHFQHFATRSNCFTEAQYRNDGNYHFDEKFMNMIYSEQEKRLLTSKVSTANNNKMTSANPLVVGGGLKSPAFLICVPSTISSSTTTASTKFVNGVSSNGTTGASSFGSNIVNLGKLNLNSSNVILVPQGGGFQASNNKALASAGVVLVKPSITNNGLANNGIVQKKRIIPEDESKLVCLYASYVICG